MNDSTASATPPPPSGSRAAARWTLAILALALLLRFEGLGAQSYWQDEALCVINARLTPGELFAVLSEQNQPPGFHLLLGGWTSIFGESEAATRSFSALAGFAAALLLAAAAKLLFGATAWLPALLLGATSSFWIFFSREATMYAVVLALGGLVQYLLLQLSLSPRRPPIAAWLLLGATRAAMLYVHYFALFLWAAEFLVVAWLAWRRRSAAGVAGWIASSVATLLLFAPWLPTFVEQRERVMENWWTRELTIARIVNAPRQWLLWLPEADHKPWNLLNAFTLAAAATWGAASLTRLRGFERLAPPAAATPGDSWLAWKPATNPPAASDAVALCLLLGGGQALATLAASISNSLFEPKYMIAASFPFFLAMAGGLAKLLSGGRVARVAGWSLLALFVATQLASFGFFRFHPGYCTPDMRSVAERIRAEFGPGDLVVAREGDAATLATLHFYLNSGGEAFPLFYFDEDGNPPPFWEGLGALPRSSFVRDPDLLGAGRKRLWLPITTWRERTWEYTEESERIERGIAAHLFQVLGGAPTAEPVAEFTRVRLYLIPSLREFDYALVWPKWAAWMEQWRGDRKASALGRYLDATAGSAASDLGSGSSDR